MLRVKHTNYDYILLRRALVVELPHAVDKVLLFLFCIYAIISSGTLSDSLATIHNLSLYARSQMVSFHVNQDRIAFPYLICKNQFCRKCLHMFL